MRPFANLWGRLFAGPQAAPAPTPPDLQSQLQDTLRQLRAEAARMEPRGTSGTAAELPRLERGWREAREQARQRLAEQILATHGRLGTGLDSDEIHRLHDALPGLWPTPDGVECRMEVHVLNFLFHRVGVLAWDRLLELLHAAELEWPVAPELSHGRSPEGLLLVLEQHLAEVKGGFLQQSPQACADLMAGEIAAWSHGYPDENSWLWQETAWRAVGAALRARLFWRAVVLWHERPPQVEQELQELMQPHLDEVRRRLAGGHLSPGQALEMLQEMEQACQEAVPLKVWCYLRASLTEGIDPDPPHAESQEN